MKNVAVFDFCETISTFQTLDPFLLFILEKEYPNKNRILRNKVVIKALTYMSYIAQKFVSNVYPYKLLLIYATKGIAEEKMWEYGKQYYENEIKPNLISETLTLLADFEKKGIDSYIVSGGSKYYINYFADEYNVEKVFTAEIEIKNGVSTGKLINDCLGNQKVGCLKKYKEKCGKDIEFTYAISDSISDQPLFSFCKKQIVLSKGMHQSWVESGMEEIIW